MIRHPHESTKKTIFSLNVFSVMLPSNTIDIPKIHFSIGICVKYSDKMGGGGGMSRVVSFS